MGGTFDPVHHGHLVAASEVAGLFGLDEVVFVPTGQPWQKSERGVSPAEDRYLMTVIATASNPRFSVSRVDIDRGGPTYTIDTLSDLRPQHPDAELFFITGADALAQIVGWRDTDELFELAHFVGVTRPGYQLADTDLPAGRGQPGGGAGAGDQLHRLPRAGASAACPSGTWCPTASCSTSRSVGSTAMAGRAAPSRGQRRSTTAPADPALAGPAPSPASPRPAGDAPMTASAEARETALIAAQAAADKLATDVSIVDVSDRLAITDVFVLASAPNERQVGVDRRRGRGPAARARHQAGPPRGRAEGRWVLLDFVDVVVHVQHAEERAYYALERLWKDCPTIPFTDRHAPAGRRARAEPADGHPADGHPAARTRPSDAADGTRPTWSRARATGDGGPRPRRCAACWSGGTGVRTGTPAAASRGSWTRRWTPRAGPRRRAPRRTWRPPCTASRRRWSPATCSARWTPPERLAPLLGVPVASTSGCGSTASAAGRA